MTGPGRMRGDCAECRTWEGACHQHRRRTFGELARGARRRLARALADR